MSENATPETPADQPKTTKKVMIDMPKELGAVYANLALISHTPVEVVLDFAQLLPRSPRGRVMSRIIMTPMHAKMLQRALAQNVSTYESKFGEIRLPQSGTPLADDFFRYSQEGPGDEG